MLYSTALYSDVFLAQHMNALHVWQMTVFSMMCYFLDYVVAENMQVHHCVTAFEINPPKPWVQYELWSHVTSIVYCIPTGELGFHVSLVVV